MKKPTDYVILPHDRALINDAFSNNRSVMIRIIRMFDINEDEFGYSIIGCFPSGATLDDTYAPIGTIPIIQFVGSYDNLEENIGALKFYPTDAVKLNNRKQVVMTEHAVIKRNCCDDSLFNIIEYSEWVVN